MKRARDRKRPGGVVTASVSTAEDTMPPTIGAAMRLITSAPVPVLQNMGSRPAMIAATVIIFGRTRSTAPSRCRVQVGDAGLRGPAACVANRFHAWSR